MKKLLAMILALVMVLSLAACGGNNAEPTEPSEAPTTEPEVTGPESALEILENTWALFGEDEKFPVMGGDSDHIVDGAPGTFDHTNTELLSYQLLVPADQAANIDDAAGLFNAMMLNNFTCGAFHVTGDAAAFAAAMEDAVMNNMWMCGFPEQLVIATVGEYVVMAYGLGEFITNFQTHLTAAYPDAQVVCDAPIV